jgi:DHA1 family bicyclomycin/chloramphenicol resistance-like MFS transporter
VAVQTHADEMPLRQRIKLVLVLGSLVGLGPLTIDMYLPAFPAIAEKLDATESAVQLTLTGTLVGVAIGQLLVGPLADAFGRRRPLITAMSGYVVVSILCAQAPSIEVLGALRVLQGVAAASGAVIAMAIVRDLFSGVTGVRMLSRLMLVMGAAPVLAPSLGAQVLRVTDWRGVFWVLALAGSLLVLVAAVGIRETLPPERRRPSGVGNALRTYGRLIRERKIVGLFLTSGLMMAALFAYVSGSSFVLQDGYGLSEQEFGLVFAIGAIGLITATQFNARLAVRHGPQRVLLVAVPVASVAAAVFLLTATTGWFGLPGIVVPLFASVSMVGFTLPNVQALALADHGRNAGSAAGLIGSSHVGFGAVTAPLVGALGTATAVPMAAIMLTATVGAVTAVYVIVRPTFRSAAESTDEPVAATASPRLQVTAAEG